MRPLQRKPKWIKVKSPTSLEYNTTRKLVRNLRLNTVCEEAACPNIGECWSKNHATVMILGDICTRSCGFCSVKTGKPLDADLNEPKRTSEFVKKLNLRHVVVTSVDRDDLKKDFGAKIWYDTIVAIRQNYPECTIEVLTPDFKGSQKSLDKVFNAKPNIFSHNIECVERISREIRPQSDWNRSLDVLKYAVKNNMVTKTGMMVGLGEFDEEVYNTMDLIQNIGIEIFNIGQYLQPTIKHVPVNRYVTPEQFENYKEYGLTIGFKVVESGPLVRSSYHADQQARELNNIENADKIA